jgi:uncharacterized protein GlcG (DUF336 family)
MPLSTEECRRLIDAAHARAGQIGIRVTVAIVDEAGLLLALARMDGAPPSPPRSLKQRRAARPSGTATAPRWRRWRRTVPLSSRRSRR